MKNGEDRMRCIFCLEDKLPDEFNDEHIFPEAIGGKLHLFNAVCKNCNSTLGSRVDSKLADHFMIRFKREQYQLSGKDGNVPNPFKQGILVSDDRHKVKTKLEDGKFSEIYITPVVNKEELADGNLKINMTIDAKDKKKIPGMIQKMIKRSGSKVELSEEDIKRIFSFHDQEIKNPEVRFSVDADLIKYMKAIVKIAYELGHYWLGEAYKQDAVGNNLRRAIIEENDPEVWHSQYQIKGTIRLYEEPALVPIYEKNDGIHIACTFQKDNSIACYTRIFKIMEGVLEISHEAGKYKGFENQFIAIDVAGGKVKECKLSEALLEYVKSIRATRDFTGATNKGKQ